MSVPRPPSDPPRPTTLAATAAAAQTGADPPIIGDESPEDQPNPDPEEGTPQPAEPAPRRELPRLQQPARGQRLLRKADAPTPPLTAEQRLLLLDVWRRSGLPAGRPRPARRDAAGHAQRLRRRVLDGRGSSQADRTAGRGKMQIMQSEGRLWQRGSRWWQGNAKTPAG
jgi:hypothetical protein